MFGMDRNTLLKIQIIEILDGLQNPISLKELQEMIGYASLGTIRLNCKELQAIIEKLYTEDRYSLTLRIDNGRGIQMVRSSTNLQSLTSYLYQHDLACEILCTILAKRKLSAIQFCMDKNISESKLRRKIKEINRELADYDLYISCSTQISLKGREVDIRRFYYLFMRGLYHQFAQIKWADTVFYLKLAQKIEEHLKITNNPTNLELISFWLLITNQSLGKKGKLSFTEAEKKWLNRFKYPKKPAFLNTWDQQEWKFFLYVIYSSQLHNFELQSKKPAKELFFTQAIAHWIKTFAAHFRTLNGREKKLVTRKLKQHYASYAFFRLNDQIMDQLSSSIALKKARTEFPYYFQRFEAFWQEFIQTVPEFNHRQLCVYSFLTCVTLYSLENCLPEISVYVFSEHSELFSVFMQEKIDLQFRNRYHLTFVTDPREAQLIIGTTPTCETFLSEGQSHVIIRSNISNTDYADIETIMADLVKKELAKCQND